MVEADSSSDLEVEERGWELRNDVVGDRIEVGWLLVEVDGVVGLGLGLVFPLLSVATSQPGLFITKRTYLVDRPHYPSCEALH
jgi:hypothetical protein